MRPLALLLFVVSFTAYADTLILKDGTKQEGTVVDEDGDTISLKVKFGVVKYKKSEVKDIVRAGAAPVVTDPATMRDVIKLKSGVELVGLLASDTGGDIEFDAIQGGKSVSRTILVRTRYAKNEIADMKLLTDAQRKAAREHIETASTMAQQDKVEETKVVVTEISMPARFGGPNWTASQIELEHFTVISNADPEFLKKAAYRLGRVFSAYKQHFGVDRAPDTKFKVLIFNSMAEYSQYANGLKNPAFYSPRSKEIVAGCDIAAMDVEVKRIRESHAELTKRLNDWKAAVKDARAKVQAFVSRVYEIVNRGGKGATADGQAALDELKFEQQQWQLKIGEFEKKIEQTQAEIAALDRRNDLIFNEKTKSMFATMYHEGFHAFADGFLFDEGLSRHMPRWLNEGLAQHFELGRLEGNSFVLGAEDRARMAMLRQFKKENALAPLEDVLSNNPKDFLVHASSNIENSARNYLQSWLLVQVLDQNKRLTRQHLQNFISDLSAGRKAIDALPSLSGMPNAELQKALDDRLKPSFER